MSRKRNRSQRALRLAAQPVFTALPHNLSAETERTLAELLGYGNVDLTQEAVDHQLPGMRVVKRVPGEPLLLVHDPSRLNVEKTSLGDALHEIEGALGLAVHCSPHLDYMPRPRDYVAQFERVRREAFQLCERLSEWSGYFRDQVSLHGGDIEEIKQALASLVDISTAVVKQYKRQSSRGARGNVALRAAILRLRHAFRKHYQGPRDERKRKGAFESLAQWERRERDFVKAALLDAKVVSQRQAEKDLPRLMRDPRTRPQAESLVRTVP